MKPDRLIPALGALVSVEIAVDVGACGAERPVAIDDDTLVRLRNGGMDSKLPVA